MLLAALFDGGECATDSHLERTVLDLAFFARHGTRRSSTRLPQVLQGQYYLLKACLRKIGREGDGRQGHLRLRQEGRRPSLGQGHDSGRPTGRVVLTFERSSFASFRRPGCQPFDLPMSGSFPPSLRLALPTDDLRLALAIQILRPPPTQPTGRHERGYLATVVQHAVLLWCAFCLLPLQGYAPPSCAQVLKSTHLACFASVTSFRKLPDRGRHPGRLRLVRLLHYA